jgi:hypothetical protein
VSKKDSEMTSISKFEFRAARSGQNYSFAAAHTGSHPKLFLNYPQLTSQNPH